jgi:hypothetical protein
MTQQPNTESTMSDVAPATKESITSWTPGPWVINNDDQDDLKIESAGYEDETPGVCGSHSPQWPLTDADAALIAAAPDMLAALEACIKWFGEDGEEWACIEKARNAVKKATSSTNPAAD